jgi:hypothetical protein
MYKTTISILITFIIIMSLCALAVAQEASATSVTVPGMAIDFAYPYAATTNGKVWSIADQSIRLDMHDILFLGGPGLTAIANRGEYLYTYSINNTDDHPVAEVLQWKNSTPTTIISFTGILTNSHGTDFLEFSPIDGSMFIGFGDSAVFYEASPQHAEVLSFDSPRGKVLRVNPDTGQGYADNPFCDGDLDTMRCKIWAYGFRNPWTATWDATGDLIIADVGDHEVEEVNSHVRGKFYGWPCYEGEKKSLFAQGIPECGAGTIPPLSTLPEYSYTHEDGSGIMGAVRIYNHLIVGDFTGKIFDSNGLKLMGYQKMLVRLLENGNTGMIAMYFDKITKTSELVFLDYQFFHYFPNVSK